MELINKLANFLSLSISFISLLEDFNKSIYKLIIKSLGIKSKRKNCIRFFECIFSTWYLLDVK